MVARTAVSLGLAASALLIGSATAGASAMSGPTTIAEAVVADAPTSTLFADAPPPTTAPSSNKDQGAGTWTFVGVVLAVAAAGGALVLVQRRRTR
jgi:hypothetical protein